MSDHAPSDSAVSVSVSRQDETVSVDMRCATVAIATALEGELRGLAAAGQLKLDLSRPPAIIDGEIVR